MPFDWRLCVRLPGHQEPLIGFGQTRGYRAGGGLFLVLRLLRLEGIEVQVFLLLEDRTPSEVLANGFVQVLITDLCHARRAMNS